MSQAPASIFPVGSAAPLRNASWLSPPRYGDALDFPRVAGTCGAQAAVADARDGPPNSHKSVTDAQEILEIWRNGYNRERPHSSLENMTPVEFAEQALGGHPHGRGKGIKDTAPTTQRQRQEIWLTG